MAMYIYHHIINILPTVYTQTRQDYYVDINIIIATTVFINKLILVFN